MMMLVVILGGIMVAAGLIGLGYCVRAGFRIRREKPAPDVAEARFRLLLVVNFASVGLAALGLGLLVVGLVLGR
ncbi:hypothetical protein [Amaricoccus solimangrovi]|uniref:Uncharacterized protein n=1 Tax=Amaricoccus solimangrovi TaxID=2589815 RepID=A0A501WM20_9RHOB|nr:hypothetical protein [Amaricoccus solimangrovi]TPE48287.1 hypothetical protein FJM51_18025 [Amaricoccus solimangrovi]